MVSAAPLPAPGLPARPPPPLPAHCSPHSSASNRIIGAKDHASIQMNVAEVSPPAGFEAAGVAGADGPEPQA